MRNVKHLLLALCFCIGLTAGPVGTASALEVNVSGVMDWIFGLQSGGNFMKDKDAGYAETRDENFYARFRSRIQVELAVSDNLKGVMQFQLGRWEFGQDGYALDGNAGNATIRRAYLDWTTLSAPLHFKIGLQQLSLPGFVAGNPFFDANVAAVVAGYSLTDEMTLSAFWARPWHADNNGNGNSTDAFGLLFDAKYSNFQISPWLVYANVGNRSGFWNYTTGWDDQDAGFFGKESRVYAGGLSVEVKPVDALSIKFDGMYAKLDNRGRGNGSNQWAEAPETKGWMVALSVDYQLEHFTPGLFAWYASGDDKKDAEKGKFGRMPLLGSDGGFYPTRLSFPGAYTAGKDTWLTLSGVGTWGVGLKLSDISFIENLSHTFRLAYIGGTNDKFDKPAVGTAAAIGDVDFAAIARQNGLGFETIYLTTKDRAIEVNFDSEYQVYENLIAVLELGYIYLDVDNKYRQNVTFDGGAANSKYSRHDGYNAQLTLRYQF